MGSPEASTSQEMKRASRTVIKAQSRVLVQRLYSYFSKESINRGPLIPPANVSGRVADALQICPNTINKILKDTRSGESKTSGKKRPQPVTKPGLESYDETAIRNHIYNYYERKEWPTKRKLIKSLKNSGLFYGKKTCLSIVLKNINFKWKVINKRKCLLERTDVVISRCLFLRNIQECNLERVIFIGETWVHAGHTNSYDDNLKSSRKISFGRGGRLILTHAGSARGFIQDSFFLYKCKRSGDYHHNMSAAEFKQWFISLLDKLSPNSIIVMDNAPYHSHIIDKSPTILWKRLDIQDWLTRNNVEWSTNMLKGELMHLVNLNKPRKKKYELDELAKERGCTVLRLPPHHNQFNPIVMIWAQVKEYIGHKNMTFKLSDVKKLSKTAIESITIEDWRRCVQHAAKVIEEALKAEGILEKRLEEMIIQIRESPAHSMSDSETESDDSNDEDGESESEEELTSGEESQSGGFGMNNSGVTVKIESRDEGYHHFDGFGLNNSDVTIKTESPDEERPQYGGYGLANCVVEIKTEFSDEEVQLEGNSFDNCGVNDFADEEANSGEECIYDESFEGNNQLEYVSGNVNSPSKGTTTNKKTKQVPCSFCEFKTTSFVGLKKHIMEKHTTSIQLPDCDYN